MHYRVQWDYRGVLGVLLAKGTVVELTDAWAAAINSDAPGVVLPEPDYAPAPRAAKPARNRMAKPAYNRAAV